MNLIATSLFLICIFIIKHDPRKCHKKYDNFTKCINNFFFFSLPQKIFKRLGLFGYFKFHSRQRKLFLNILDASIIIFELRKKKL